MAIDQSRVIQLLTESLLRDLGDEVDLIFRYGSFLNGATHQYSDLDISYVPVHESTWHSITVMLDDVMIDLYPIQWSTLEQMASFDNISCTVLLQNEVLYQRNEAVGERFRALPAQLLALQQPETRRAMLETAQGIFQGLGYEYYLLSQQAKAGHQLSCLRHARIILDGVLHSLMVANQAIIDTRKLDHVLALSKLPPDFAVTVERVTHATAPDELLSACEWLMQTTRDLLLEEQQTVQRGAASFPTVLHSAYPELKGDLQHLMLACERRDLFAFTLMSLYHELMIHVTQALTGVEYSVFNSLSEYEQDLTALGFPDLLPYVFAEDFDGLHQQCQVFDQRLQQYLVEHSVGLNSFATLAELETYVGKPIHER